MRDVWSTANPNGTIPNPLGGSHNKDNNSRFVEDGSYLRLKNVQLGYTLPKTLVGKIGLSHVRFYLSGSNLLTLTKYSGYDPEVDTRRATPLTPGVDYSAYPKSIGVVAGLNLTF